MTRHQNATTIDTQLYRRTMGRFATGVGVLTTTSAGGKVIGMTANALTSVSLDPVLLLICVGKTANIMPHLMKAPCFSISFLPEDRQDLSVYFAGLQQDDPPPPFAFVEWESAPRLAGCTAAVGCRRHALHDGGDHWIVVGEVFALHRPESPPAPLIFYEGRYGRLAEGEE